MASKEARGVPSRASVDITCVMAMTRPTSAAASFSGGSTPEVLLPLSDHPLPFIVLATGIDLDVSERSRFVFAVKAHRATTHSKEAAQTEAAVARLLTSGITELGDRLGSLLWQFPPYRRFAADTLTAFLDLLPAAQDGVALRHAIEARHASFADPAAVALCRKAGVALIIVDSDKRALLGDLTAPFVYARLRRNAQGAPEGHDSAALNA